LFGVLEADETYIGGEQHGRSGRPGPESNKTIVLGIIERGGRVRCKAVPSVRAGDIYDFVGEATDPGLIDILYTDQLAAYRILDRWIDRKSLNHKLCYIDGDIHTNGIEGFWSLLKRGINGSFHHVSAKHLQRYLNEFIWRFNHRGDSHIFESLLGNCSSGGLTYANLAG
jgi:transposase